MKYPYRTWYFPLIMAFYLVICSANVIHLAIMSFQPGIIHSPHELLPVFGALSAWIYFFKPAWGHKGLLALTVITIFALGETDPRATLFHLAILALLILPFYTRRPRLIKPRLAV